MKGKTEERYDEVKFRAYMFLISVRYQTKIIPLILIIDL